MRGSRSQTKLHDSINEFVKHRTMANPNRDRETLNSDWIRKSLEYHGQPLQKIWEGEHGNQSLPELGVRDPDYAFYLTRQKHFVFQDRAKRMKVHSFIAKHANELFANDPAKNCAQSENNVNDLHEIDAHDHQAKGEICNQNQQNTHTHKDT